MAMGQHLQWSSNFKSCSGNLPIPTKLILTSEYFLYLYSAYCTLHTLLCFILKGNMYCVYTVQYPGKKTKQTATPSM